MQLLRSRCRPVRVRLLLYAVLLAAAMPMPASAQQAATREVRIAAFNYYPAIFMDADGTVRGFYVDMLDEIAHRENWKITYVYGTWNAGLERIASGEADIVTSAASTPERRRFLDFGTEPLLTVWGEVYVAEGSTIDGILTLAGKRIAVVKNDFNAASFMHLAESFRISCTFVEYADFDSVFAAIGQKDVDAGVVNSVFGSSKQKAYRLKSTGVVFNPFDIYFASAKGRNAAVLATLNRYLAQWRLREGSPYHTARDRWTHGRLGSVQVIPAWIIAAFGGLLLSLLLFVVFVILLRKKVRSATIAIADSEARHREIFESSPVSLWLEDFSAVKLALDRLRRSGVTDLDAHLEAHPDAAASFVAMVRIIDVNNATLLLHGAQSKDELLGKLGVTFTDDSRAGFNRELGSIWRGEQHFEMDTSVRHKNGTVIEVALHMRVAPGCESTYSRVLLSLHDLTERQKMQDIMQRTAKLESLGVLAGGIAHDFNNLLGGLFGYIDMARELSPDHTPVKRYLDKSMQVFDRARNLTQQLLTFAKGGKPVRRTGSIARLLRETTTFAMSGSAVSCDLRIADDLRLCSFDENQIAQVIDNILINAQQAMPLGGTIVVTAENYSVPRTVRGRSGSGLYVRVAVTDTGTGIARDHLSRIFDPFFTTKQKGHGLGLATCYSIVHAHDGFIDVDSELGRGSTFSLYLPITDEAPADERAPALERHTGSGTILVMDDEEFNREIAGEMLRSMGYDVREAADGQKALHLIREALERGAVFDAILLDLTIPGGMGGKDAVAEIRTLHAATPIFASSGYSDDPVMPAPADFGFTDKLPKPFTLQDMTSLLNRHMRANGGPSRVTSV